MSIGRFAATLGMVAFLSLASASDAAAEPITFSYRIDITERCLASECGQFSVSFPLVLSFDSAVTLAIDEPGYSVREYGAPTFSDIPLQRPDVFPGASEFSGTVDIARQNFQSSDWIHVANALRGASLVIGDIDYVWNRRIYEAAGPFPSAPTLSPALFGPFLGSGANPTAFIYGFFGLLGSGEVTSDSVPYSGTAVSSSRRRQCRNPRRYS